MTDGLNLAVRNLVRAVLAMPDGSVRPANQLSPAGGQTKEIATVLIIDCRGLGTGDTAVVDDGAGGLEEEIQQLQQFTASVQFFRSPAKDATGTAKHSTAAFDRAARMGQLLRLSTNAQRMQRMGVGLLTVSPARNLTALTDTAWESRGQVDLTFNIVNREALAVATIETVPLILSLQQPGGTETRSSEVTS